MISIPVIYSFARSGGTLVNQLLGVHPDLLILSEVNPAASVVSVSRQASDWLNLIEAAEIDQFQELPYAQQITLLDKRAKAKGKALIIRDWVTVNYLSTASGGLIISSCVLEQPVYLARVGYSVMPLVVTRKAQSVYQSLRSNFSHLSDLSVDDFLSAYLSYARAVSSFPRVSLEDMQSAPRETLIRILQALGFSLDYIDMQLEMFADFRRCTGNNTLVVPSASSHLRQIVPLSSDFLASNKSLDKDVFKEVDHLMGYKV